MEGENGGGEVGVVLYAHTRNGRRVGVDYPPTQSRYMGGKEGVVYPPTHHTIGVALTCAAAQKGEIKEWIGRD